MPDLLHMSCSDMSVCSYASNQHVKSVCNSLVMSYPCLQDKVKIGQATTRYVSTIITRAGGSRAAGRVFSGVRLCVRVSVRLSVCPDDDSKTEQDRITQLDSGMIPGECWKPIYFGVRRSISGFVDHWVQSPCSSILTLLGFLWRSVQKCSNHNRKTAKIGICTPLNSEFYFRFWWPPNTKSKLINFSSVRIFETIREKTWQPLSKTCQNRHSHISKIGSLLPVCLTNNRRRSDQISEPHAKFGENR